MNTHPTLPSDFDFPPPTFNTLDSQQKTRLIRTTRKLGAVLGTTPHLAETSSPISFPPSRPPLNAEKPQTRPKFSPKNDRKRRQGSVFEIASPSKPYAFDYASSSASSSAASLGLPRSSTDSSSSDASTRSLPAPRSFARHVREKSKGSSSSKRAPLPTPLVLRLNAVALPLSDPRLTTPPDSAATLKNAGLAPGGGNRTPMPVTPTTPGTPTTPTVTETRRKRLAKLKRTLGENVPAELVIPTPRAASSRRPSPLEGPAAAAAAHALALAPFPLMGAPQKQADRDPQQYHTMYARPPPPRAQKTYPIVYAVPSSGPARTSPRKRSVSVDFKNGFMAPPYTTSPPVTVTPRPAPKLQLQPQPIRRAPSLSSRHAPAWSPPAAAPPPPEPIGTSDLELGSGSESESESESESGHSQRWVTGGSSWKGEWNRKDIHEVQRQLRNLKLR